jgi:protein-glutamine gamma-glutamyltransferase
MDKTISSTQRRLSLLASFMCCLPMLLLLPGVLMTSLFLTILLGFFYSKQLPGILRFLLVMLLGAMVMITFQFGIGRDTASAGLLAMLSIKPFESHSSRDAKSLLGFSLFAPLAAFLQDQGPITLGLCTPAILLSFMAYASLSKHAESVFHWRAQIKPALVTLLMALPLALASFWLFPRLNSPLWGLPKNAIGNRGLGDRMEPSEWLDKFADDNIVMRASFLGVTPRRDQMYWRGPVLSRFDGSAWIRDQGAYVRDRPSIKTSANLIAYEVMLEPTSRNDLLVLDLPTQAPENSTLSTEFTAVVVSPIDNVQRYQGQSTLAPKFIEPLDNITRSVTLQLPRELNPRTRALALQWQAEEKDSIKLAERFLKWIQKDFQYSLDAPLLGRDSADDFLFNTKRGFCQHFSSSFAVFMRSAGVPTRVVTGFAGGKYNQVGRYWMLYGKDAHAWTEIWVEGRGWVRIDPTAAVAPENILDTVDDLAANGAVDSFLSRTLDSSDWLRRGWNEMVLGFNAARQRNLLKPLGIDTQDIRQLTIVFMIGIGLTLAFTMLLLLRQRRENLPEIERAWRRFNTYLRQKQLGKLSHEPALAYAERLTGTALLNKDPTTLASKRIQELCLRYSQWRYEKDALDSGEIKQLALDLRQFRLTAQGQ